MGENLMPVMWNLRDLLKERGITRASEVSRIIRERTGYKLSTQAVCDLLNSEPKMVRIETTAAFCDAFYCRLSDFFEVSPSAGRKPQTKLRQRGGPPSSSNDELRPKASEVGGKPRKDRSLSSEMAKIDFASFYPDAHKFPGSTDD